MTVKEQQKTKTTFKCKICGKEVTQSLYSFNKSGGVCKGCKIKQSPNTERFKHIKEVFLKKYGVENPSQLKSVKSKRKETAQNRFGVDNPAKADAIKEKTKNTNIERFGVSCSLHNDDVAKKVEKTMIEKYGVKYSLQSKDIRQKAQQTMIERYGSPFPSQNEDILEKQQKSKREAMHQQFEERCIRLLRLRNFKFTKVSDLLYECICPVCGHKWLWTSYKWVDEMAYHPILFCSKCWRSGHSMYETELISIIPKSINYVSNDRTVLKPKELDLYFPNNNLAIEFDGDYWHNDSLKTYQKMQLCEEKNIRLINIFEHEFDKEKIKSVLYSALNVTPQKIYYARKCELIELDNSTYNKFCDENHIQGKAAAKIRLGLIFNNELIQVMSFNKPRFSKKYEWEMIRECTKNCCAVVGGEAKLFKYFLNTYNPKSIISYCDRRYFTGSSYLNLGFTLDHISKPSYFYVKNNEILTRYQCQKHKLQKLLNNYDPQLSETDNMIANGYFKLYDFGEKVFTYTTK